MNVLLRSPFDERRSSMSMDPWSSGNDASGNFGRAKNNEQVLSASDRLQGIAGTSTAVNRREAPADFQYHPQRSARLATETSGEHLEGGERSKRLSFTFSWTWTTLPKHSIDHSTDGQAHVRVGRRSATRAKSTLKFLTRLWGCVLAWMLVLAVALTLFATVVSAGIGLWLGAQWYLPYLWSLLCSSVGKPQPVRGGKRGGR